ncbi:MAG: hypothetical protein H0X66_01940 [Verrucomicrobia bacterium]|nr:hypothetical protein [Verrucomicrobiota bacterium]
MKNLAIHPNQWGAFCEAFTELNRGTLMSVDLHHLDNRRDGIARDAVFQEMIWDTSPACSSIITLRFGQEGEMRTDHVVIEPIHLRVKQNGDGQKFLQIEAENGVTLVNFRSGRLPMEDFESEFKSFGRGKNQSEVAASS